MPVMPVPRKDGWRGGSDLCQREGRMKPDNEEPSLPCLYSEEKERRAPL